MRYEIDWSLEQEQFKNTIRRMINKAVKHEKVLPLPFFIDNTDNISNIITAILSQINCSGCSAPCCKSNPNGKPLDISKPEYLTLSLTLGKDVMVNKGIKLINDWAKVPMPCPFLKDNRCSIYSLRPFVCIIYPLERPSTDQFGRPMLSLASVCPEARRIAKDTYMYHWRIKRKLDELGNNYIERVLKSL